MKRLVLILACCLAAFAAQAQVAPSEAERAAYAGLHAAAARNDAAAVKAEVAAGAAIDARDPYGRTPAMVAAHAEAHEALAALIAAGADLDLQERDRYDVLTISAVRDDVAAVRMAIAAGADTKAITSIYDGTALIAAAHLGHEGVITALIAGGAPLDHVNNLGWTALIEAIVLGDGGPRHQATLKALIDGGADVNLADGSGRTPLALAQARGYGEMEAMLRAAGAGP